MGRFTQQDGWEFANPEDPLSLNLYTYCWNNPIQYIDPSGCFVDAKYKYQSMNEGGIGGGGAAIFLLDKIAYGLGKIGEFFTNIVNNIGTDNIAKLATNGDDAIKNSFNEIVDQIEKTTNPPEPEDEWDIHNLKPGEKWINGQPYHDVLNKAHHIFENKLHDHQLNSFLESFGNDELEAYQAMTKAAQDYTNVRGLSNENFNGVTQAFKINGFDVMIRFSNINGYVRVTSAYIPT